MKIIFKTRNVKLTSAIEKLASEKINSLEKFGRTLQGGLLKSGFDKKGKSNVEALIEIGRENLHHKKGNIYFAACQLKFPRKVVKASASSDSPQKAIALLKEELELEIKKVKEKVVSVSKRKSRSFKRSMRITPEADFISKDRTRDEGI